MNNEMSLTFKALSINESFARASVAAFCLQANPSLDEITDVKTAVSEAVTNSIVHGYGGEKGTINIFVGIKENVVYIKISDRGVGIDDIEKAKQPFFTTKSKEERSGMGFTIIENFMDEMKVESIVGMGTKVYMKKYIKEA